jgi:hypothetical protein
MGQSHELSGEWRDAFAENMTYPWPDFEKNTNTSNWTIINI